jgi:hypothetical protein
MVGSGSVQIITDLEDPKLADPEPIALQGKVNTEHKSKKIKCYDFFQIEATDKRI